MFSRAREKQKVKGSATADAYAADDESSKIPRDMQERNVHKVSRKGLQQADHKASISANLRHSERPPPPPQCPARCPPADGYLRLEIAELQKVLVHEREKFKAQQEHLAVVEKKFAASQKALRGEEKRRQEAERRCASLQEEVSAMSEEIACEQEKREAAEERCASLEMQVSCEQEKCEAAETLLQVQFDQLAGEKEKFKAANKQRAALEEEIKTVSKTNEELKIQLQTQKGISGLCHSFFWQYKSDDGSWAPFTPEATEEMLQGYLRYRRKAPDSRFATITSGGAARRVDFQLMQQQHLATQKVRGIRLQAGVPEKWDTPAADLLVQSDDLECLYKEVKNKAILKSIQNVLTNTGHAKDKTTDCHCMSRAKIKSVHRIENMRLWRRYKTRLAEMRQDHAIYGISVGSAELDLDGRGNVMKKCQQIFDSGEALAADVDEKILLHGTSWGKADLIVQEGFDPRVCQNGFYGDGVYFACAACKSHQYTCEENCKWCCTCKCERTLILARVALGDSYAASETRKGKRRAPQKSSSVGTYDSIVVKPGPVKGHHNPNQVHQEYVIFDREQAYPSYVVQYTV
eukprot:Skav224240  [mRNA]  locus=scaffold939:1351977:1353707:- [translate_table: standard]